MIENIAFDTGGRIAFGRRIIAAVRMEPSLDIHAERPTVRSG